MDIFPQIVISYESWGKNGNGQMIYVLEKTTHDLIDSVGYSMVVPQFVIDKWLMLDIFGEEREIKQYDYILESAGRQDTVKDINYNRISEIIDCNICFPYGNGSATLTAYENLEFMINQKVYVDVDSVFIK